MYKLDLNGNNSVIKFVMKEIDGFIAGFIIFILVIGLCVYGKCVWNKRRKMEMEIVHISPNNNIDDNNDNDDENGMDGSEEESGSCNIGSGLGFIGDDTPSMGARISKYVDKQMKKENGNGHQMTQHIQIISVSERIIEYVERELDDIKLS